MTDTVSTKSGSSAQPAIVSLTLLHTCLNSAVDISRLCNMYIVKAYLTGVTCEKFFSGKSHPKYFIVNVCYWFRVSSKAYVELRDTDLLITIRNVPGIILGRLSLGSIFISCRRGNWTVPLSVNIKPTSYILVCWQPLLLNYIFKRSFHELYIAQCSLPRNG